jgi:hypothetical protein
MNLAQFIQRLKKICSQPGMGKDVNILPAVNKIAKMNDMVNVIRLDKWNEKFIYAPLEIVKENWRVISNSPVSIGNE